MQYQFLGGAHHVLDAVGLSMLDAYGSPAAIAATQLAAAELFGHDTAMAPWGCLTVEAEAVGCGLEYHDRWYPQVRRRPLAASTDLADIDTLETGLPTRMSVMVDSLSEIRARADDDLFVIAMVVSPFLVAAELRDMSQLMLDIGLRPSFVSELLDRVTAELGHYIDAIAATGAADAIMFENAGMAAELLGPHHVQEFIVPFHRRLVAHTRAAAPSVLVIEHNCAANPYFAEIQATDVDAVSFATPDIDAALEPASVDRGLAGIGMVDHRDLLLNGRAVDVRDAAVACITRAGDRPFVLSTGCEIPFKAPPANIAALAEAARATVDGGRAPIAVGA